MIRSSVEEEKDTLFWTRRGAGRRMAEEVDEVLRL